MCALGRQLGEGDWRLQLVQGLSIAATVYILGHKMNLVVGGTRPQRS